MALDFNLFLPLREFDLDISGRFESGITGIYGPSGAGKTTFFNLISGLEKPEKGFVSLNKRVLTDSDKNLFVPTHKRKIGVVFQEKYLFPHLSVKENLTFGLPYVKNKKISLDDVVDLFNLKMLLKSKPHEISGGEQQRTAMGRAILTSPELLLFDEPFNAVDYTLRATILPYIKKLKDVLDIPVLVISHDLSDLQSLTSQIYFMSRGKEQGFGDIIAYLKSTGPVIPAREAFYS
jgi:molybdate transport system ATP-binding protein